MLVASRDPFHGEHHVAPARPAGGHIARTMSLLQVVGTVLAIPVGLGSAYTMYKSNFTAESSCQALRANIIQILDKGVDASARHMLVRRDVEAFEQTCGGVDPDAVAAFKSLLKSDKTAVAAAAPRRVETQPKIAEVKPADIKAAETKPVERKVENKIETRAETKVDTKPEPRQDAIAKMMSAKPATPVAPVAVAAVPPQREAGTSDAEWLEAVRGALVAHAPDTDAAEPMADAPAAAELRLSDSKPAEAKPVAKTAIVAPLVRQAVREAPPMSIENVRTPPLATVSAPTLPPPAAVESVPEPQPEKTARADNHPVPPGAIPETVPEPEGRSRIGELMSYIPGLNRVLDK
jgi:hypothetical protein